ELIVLFATLYGHWSDTNAVAAIWQGKMRTNVVYQSSGGNITVEQGFWFSAHEMWGRLHFPYLEDPLSKAVFENGERARTWHSHDYRIPGLLASANQPREDNGDPAYVSNYGIGN